MLLFVVLTPGILLTIPPVGKKIFGSGKSSLVAACVHAVIFVVLMNWFHVEGFQTQVNTTSISPIFRPMNISNRHYLFVGRTCRNEMTLTNHSKLGNCARFECF